MKKYIVLKNNLERIYLSQKTKINSYTLITKNFRLMIEIYKHFITIKINEIVTIFYFLNEKKEKPFNDFIDVTSNKKYQFKNILRGSLKKLNIVIEGADGVGKTTLVRELAKRGYLTQDRAIKEVTQKMREETPEEERVQGVKTYLMEDKNRKLVFLYLSEESELEKRINSREVISEYDKKALVFQKLYIDTYNKISDFNNLYIIDCLGKTLDDLVKEIEKLIERV